MIHFLLLGDILVRRRQDASFTNVTKLCHNMDVDFIGFARNNQD
jgi:hypothetical protein